MIKNISYIPLIKQWEAFLKTDQGTGIEDFAKYILDEAEKKSKSGPNQIEGLPPRSADYPYLTAEAGQAIFRLYKFSKMYSRPIMSDVGLNSFDEFSIMTTLLNEKETAKKYLIEKNLIEFTTGMDMLKRMFKQKLIQERVNPDDKREKLVSLSENGRKVLFKILEGFQTMEDVLGDLNKKEREETIRYLERLDRYHSSLNN